MSHPVELLRRALAANPSRPLITFYDDATDERVELSVKTFDNWVAKTANLLVDGLGAAPPARVALALPGHWQTAVWLFACWSAGLTAVPLGDDDPIPDGADIVAAGPARVAEAAEAAPSAEVVGLSLHALGAPLTDVPPGVIDYAVEVRGYGDRFAGPLDSGAVAVESRGRAVTAAELVAEARALDTPAGARVLTTVSFATLSQILSSLIGPLLAGGSVIICQNLKEERAERRISLENVTSVIRSGSTRSAP